MLSDPKILNLALQATLALIMFSVGLSLQQKELRLVGSNRYLIGFGVLVKLVIFPALALLLIYLFPLEPLEKFSIVVLFLCPGGTTSNVITYWTKGNSALTIFLTAAASAFVFFTLPIMTNLAAQVLLGTSASVALPIYTTGRDIFLLILLPTGVGMAVRQYYPAPAKVLEKIIARVSVVFLAVVYSLKFFFPADASQTVSVSAAGLWKYLPLLLTLNIGGMVLVLFAGRLFFDRRNARTLGIEMGIQNVPLAILIGDAYLQLPGVSEPALLYAMFSFWTTLGFAYLAGRTERSTPPAPAPSPD
ncbi:MAG: bile acid:sodium symporter [Bacteroidota bacterium]